jgi:uncharacterized membrane protein YcaP (DUF421 family)
VSNLVFFTDGWMPLLRIVVVGTLMYVTLIVLLRISGSRTIASMRAFDFIVTVALGSVFGRALTAKGVSLAEAVVAFVLLISLQYAVARLQVLSQPFARAVTNPPRLLYFRGEFQTSHMRSTRVTKQELRAVARKQGHGSLDDVEALVLEASGDISVITKVGDGSALGRELKGQINRHHE